MVAMLNELIETAYKIFSAYPVPQTLGASLFPGDDSQARLRVLAVREISDDLLWRYHLAYHATKTPVAEIKHFLPRYLEIVSHFQFGHFWTEIALNRLRLIENEWTLEERELLDIWASTFFAHCLSQYRDGTFSPDAPHIENIADIIIMLAHGGFALEPLLDSWAKNESLSALLHYKDLLLWGFNASMTALENSFAEDDHELFTTLAIWVQHPGVVKHFLQESKQAIEQHEPVLNRAHGFHGGRSHLEELEITQQRLKKWQKVSKLRVA
jgi:hypothetical protein